MRPWNFDVVARLTLLHALHGIDDRWGRRSRIDNESLKCRFARDNTIVIHVTRGWGFICRR